MEKNVKKGKNNIVIIVVIVIAVIVLIWLIRFISAFNSVNGMFNQAKQATFVTQVQYVIDASTTQFMQDSLNNPGEGMIYSNIDNKGNRVEQLDDKDEKYYISLDRNRNVLELVVYNDTFCYEAEIDDEFDKTDVMISDLREHKDNDSYSGCKGDKIQ